MNKWYEEGLLDPNYLPPIRRPAMRLSPPVRPVLWGAVGGGIGKYMEAAQLPTPT